MSKIAEKPRCLEWLHRQRITGVRSCNDLLTRAAIAALGKSQIDAEAFAAANEKAFWNYIAREDARLEELGLSLVFEPLDYVNRTFNCLALPDSASPEQWHHALKLRSRPDYLSAIDILSDREYEALGCVVAEALGATKVHLTPKGTEGGVDFYAALRHANSSHLFGSSNAPIRLVGQSKKYTHAFSAPGFKEFLQTLEEVKHRGEPKTEKAMPPWFKAARGPIIGVVIAHAGFQSGAESRAKAHGVIVTDSVGVAEVLCLKQDLADYETDPLQKMTRRIAELIGPVAAS